jgi:CDGSH-type Zn-finger protein/uncharacterized Fe-S cluster protein YjdI
MESKVCEFGSDEIKVTYDVKRCIHAAECVKGLPEVFNPKRRPWVDPDAALVDDIATVISRCPTGALSIEYLDGREPEAADENTVTVVRDGPLYLRGDIEVVDKDGNTLLRDTRVALCRCGASKNKPLCDGQHEKAGFRDEGVVNIASAESDTLPVLTVKVLQNGPVSLSGGFRVIDNEGNAVERSKGALCRCGYSENKPFCDGAHLGVGFEAD